MVSAVLDCGASDAHCPGVRAAGAACAPARPPNHPQGVLAALPLFARLAERREFRRLAVLLLDLLFNLFRCDGAAVGGLLAWPSSTSPGEW